MHKINAKFLQIQIYGLVSDTLIQVGASQEYLFSTSVPVIMIQLVTLRNTLEIQPSYLQELSLKVIFLNSTADYYSLLFSPFLPFFHFLWTSVVYGVPSICQHLLVFEDSQIQHNFCPQGTHSLVGKTCRSGIILNFKFYQGILSEAVVNTQNLEHQ